MKPDHRIVEPTQNEEPSMRLVRVMPRVVPTNKEVLRYIVHVCQNGIAGESGYYGRVRIYGQSCAIIEPGNQRLRETCSNVL